MGDKPNGLENTTVYVHKISLVDHLVSTVEVVPTTTTRLEDDGTVSSRYYMLDMHLERYTDGEPLHVIAHLPEEYKEPLIKLLAEAHFPDQACPHEGHDHG